MALFNFGSRQISIVVANGNDTQSCGRPRWCLTLQWRLSLTRLITLLHVNPTSIYYQRPLDGNVDRENIWMRRSTRYIQYVLNVRTTEPNNYRSPVQTECQEKLLILCHHHRYCHTRESVVLWANVWPS